MWESSTRTSDTNLNVLRQDGFNLHWALAQHALAKSSFTLDARMQASQEEVTEVSTESRTSQVTDSNTADKVDDVPRAGTAVPETSKEFLLAEFREATQLWRHTDSRIETATNFYLTIGAITLPGSILLFKQLENHRDFVASMMPIVTLLALAGVLLVNRINSADLRKGDYELCRSLVMRYFVDQDDRLADYLLFPLAEPGPDLSKKVAQLRPYFHSSLTSIINVFTALLLSSIPSACLWLAGIQSDIILALTCFLGATAIYISLHFLYKKRSAKYRDPSRWESHWLPKGP
jgi:hypothetical protein